MTDLGIEYLEPDRVTDLWEYLEPIVEASCQSNEIGSMEMNATDVYLLAQAGMCVMFVGTEDGVPKCMIAFQFHHTNGKKGADLIAMGGQKLMKFRDAYWDTIIEWLRQNECEFLDAYATERLAKHYMTKFGFNKSCTYVRMVL